MALRIVATHVPQGGRRDRVQVEKAWRYPAQELQELLKNNSKAEKVWNNTLSAGERRDFVLFVADAKKPETRMRRARRLLGR